MTETTNTHPTTLAATLSDGNDVVTVPVEDFPNETDARLWIEENLDNWCDANVGRGIGVEFTLSDGTESGTTSVTIDPESRLPESVQVNGEDF